MAPIKMAPWFLDVWCLGAAVSIEIQIQTKWFFFTNFQRVWEVWFEKKILFLTMIYSSRFCNLRGRVEFADSTSSCFFVASSSVDATFELSSSSRSTESDHWSQKGHPLSDIVSQHAWQEKFPHSWQCVPWSYAHSGQNVSPQGPAQIFASDSFSNSRWQPPVHFIFRFKLGAESFEGGSFGSFTAEVFNDIALLLRAAKEIVLFAGESREDNRRPMRTQDLA